MSEEDLPPKQNFAAPLGQAREAALEQFLTAWNNLWTAAGLPPESNASQRRIAEILTELAPPAVINYNMIKRAMQVRNPYTSLVFRYVLENTGKALEAIEAEAANNGFVIHPRVKDDFVAAVETLRAAAPQPKQRSFTNALRTRDADSVNRQFIIAWDNLLAAYSLNYEYLCHAIHGIIHDPSVLLFQSMRRQLILNDIPDYLFALQDQKDLFLTRLNTIRSPDNPRISKEREHAWNEFSAALDRLVEGREPFSPSPVERG